MQKNLEQVSLRQYYGNLRPYQNYTCVKRENDYVVIRQNGRLIYVPKNLVFGPVNKADTLEEYQDIVDEFYGEDGE